MGIGIVSEFLRSNLRREMKDRTQEILISVREVKESLDRNTTAIEKVLRYLEENPNPSPAALDAFRNTSRLVNADKRLGRAVGDWMVFMGKVVDELQ